MTETDITLLDPAPESLARHIESTIARAWPNGDGLIWTLQAAVDLQRDITEQASGIRRWTSANVPYGWELDEPMIAVFWWWDYLRRCHVLIRSAYTSEFCSSMQPDSWDELPPLLLIYPAAGFLVEGHPVVVCACGAIGTPEDIAWMGTECGPCHDRRTADELPRRTWEVPAREFRPARRWLHGFRWLDDSRCAFQDEVTWHVGDAVTGDIQRLNPQPDNDCSLAWSPDNSVLAAWDSDNLGPGIHLLRAHSLEILRTLPESNHVFNRVLFSPDGRLVVTLQDSLLGFGLDVWDWQRPGEPLLAITEPVEACTITEDSQSLWVVRRGFVVERYDLAGSQAVHRVSVHPKDCPPDESQATGVACVPGGLLAIWGFEMRLLLVEEQTGSVVGTLPLPGISGPGNEVRDEEGRVLVLLDSKGQGLELIRLPELKRIQILPLTTRPWRWVTANDRWLAVGDNTHVRLLPWPPLVEWFLWETRA